MNASRLLVLIAMCLAAAFSFGAGPASPAAAAAITVDGATVYDENNNGQADTDGDTWAYTDDGGAAYLLVRYRIEDNRRVAYLYDDVTGDGKIDFTPSGEGLTITEPQWRLKLTVREPGADWWIPGRLPNVNLDVDVASAYVFQGGAANMMMINAPEPRNKASGGLLNGAPWVKVQLYDSQKAGVLDIRRDNANIEAYGFDTIVVNKSPRPAQIGDERLPLLNVLILLDRGQKRIQQLSRERLPVLGEDGYILFFSPAPGRPKPDPASADTRYPWEFFGFYDLAGDKDGRSEANLRFINDINFNSISYYNEARYSWSDRTNGADYRLSGVGLQPFHQVTAYPFYPAAHVPWAEAQNWFVTREWMAGNFAEDEGGRHSATIGEGLPPNGEWESAERRRVLFRERERFVPPYLPIELGVREENSLNWNQKPSLYLSAIDRRVHMTAAESGIIVYEAETVNNTIGQGYGGADFTLPELATGKARTHSKVEYQDIDHDGRVDHWTWFKEDKPAAILYSGNGKLVYADADGLRIKTLPADFATAVDLGAPPTNPQEWNKFHETLAPNYQRERLDNLRGLFDAAPGEVQEIPHMGLTEVRPRPNGLSLLVTLGADTPLPDWVERDTATDAEESGSFLLRYDGRYRLNSLTPAQLAAPNGLEITNTAPFQADRVEVRLRLRNTGDTPVRNANITLFSRTPGGLKPLAGQIANLQGEDETTVTLFWVPDAPGLQDLVAIDISSKDRVPLAAASVTVQARRSPNPLELLALSTETPAPILAGAALLASTLALAVFLRVSTEEGKDGG